MSPGEDDNAKGKWTVHRSSRDKGQRKEENSIMAVVEMEHMEADGGMDEVGREAMQLRKIGQKIRGG